MTHFIADSQTIANDLMPNLGYEIEDFQYHTWRITSWGNLEKRITGPEFEAGGWKWHILLFPFGNNNSNVVSIYLDFADLKDAPTGWHSCVQFALLLWNPEDPTSSIYHNAHHCFNAEEPDWGFTRFCNQHKLFTPSEEHTRSLIENGCCNITAFVRILKEPTGLPWHNFVIDYDSRIVTGYVGLINQGATDYMNVELQLLYSIKYFRKAIYQILTEDDEPIKSIPLAMQRIFYQLQVSNTSVETTELTKSFGWDSSNCYVQHDVQEFDRVLLDYLENKMKNKNADDTIPRLFAGKMKSYIRCVNVNYEYSYTEDYYDILLEVKGYKTLNDSFMNYILEKSCEGINKYQTENYGLQDVKKSVIFESFPPVLRIQLKRFEYDLQGNTIVKINDRFEYPLEIDLQRYLSPDSDRSKPHNYLLHGVIFHSGYLHEGSYYVFIKPEKNGKWFKFDDDRIIPVNDKEVLEDNAINSINAYMLIYIRESDIDFVLSPILAGDIPKHLQRRLDEEKALYEQRKKETEEPYLYLSTKIVTPDIFEHYQGFDLVNFKERQYPLSEIPQVKVLKTETYEAFKAMVAHKFDIPVEQIRLWIFIKRQNRTIRPDTLIFDSFLGEKMEKIRRKMVPRCNELKLFLEVAKTTNGKIWFPPAESSFHILVFIKYFNPDTQSLKGICHLYVQRFDQVSKIIPILCEKKEFPPNTPLKIYEEIKPDMIEEMNLIITFQQSEIQNGDIICFQKALTEDEIQEHNSAGRIHDIPTFYESLSMRIIIKFKPKYIDKRQNPEFMLVLNKKYTYDDVAKHVAIFLRTDPLKLRFTTAYQTSGANKAVIKRTTTQTLSEMLQTIYPPGSVLLYYEMLDINIVELETNKFFKVYWLGTTVKEEDVIDIFLPKTAIVNQIFQIIVKKLALKHNSRIRLYGVLQYKIQKEYDINDSIDEIQENVTLYAEEIPQDEIDLGANDKVIQVYHFIKDPLCTHGIPFKFVIKAGEPFATTKLRLKLRLGMNAKDFSKVKIAIVQALSYAKPQYINNDVILSDYGLTDEFLGLDHFVFHKLEIAV
ncbi:putative ubiquitin-specific processing protease 21 [Gigaspora margarita]|uniref:ubiquitinyl hydrolase 1 n=2 Tax=Gigaspora margarita TaxID=4874 RepID=A0A8H4B060_GIGMA|nr:putative ubiquitin-specific processing protease 21 [Gigaspora margarita]